MFKDVSYDNLLLRHVTEYILVWKLSEWRTTCMHERLSAHRSTLRKESRKKQLTRAPSSSFRHSVIFTSKWAKRPLTKSISRTIELTVNSLTLVSFMPRAERPLRVPSCLYVRRFSFLSFSLFYPPRGWFLSIRSFRRWQSEILLISITGLDSVWWSNYVEYLFFLRVMDVLVVGVGGSNGGSTWSNGTVSGLHWIKRLAYD